jgi:hypothetical protein
VIPVTYLNGGLSKKALKRSVHPNRFEALLGNLVYRSKVSILVKELPFTFVELSGEYEGNQHFRVVLPITILDFGTFSSESFTSEECLKISVYNYNQILLR